jgi:hypothetical protein
VNRAAARTLHRHTKAIFRIIASRPVGNDPPQRNLGALILERTLSAARGTDIIRRMNTFNPYVAGISCTLKGGATADHRMTELNELIATAKAFDRARSAERLHRTRFGFCDRHRRPPLLKTAN